MNNRGKWKFSKEIKSDNVEVKLDMIRFEIETGRIRPGWDPTSEATVWANIEKSDKSKTRWSGFSMVSLLPAEQEATNGEKWCIYFYFGLKTVMKKIQSV